MSKANGISVAIASFRERRLLDACLASLERQCEAAGAEIVVARDARCGDLGELARDHPRARFVPAAHDADVPRLRATALAHARGRWVALTEDHCVAAEDWLQRLLAACDGTADIVGGAMDNARRTRGIDWGAFFAEYGFFAQGAGRGEPPLVTAANVAYAREILPEVIRLTAAGEWENVVHDHVARQGNHVKFEPSARILQNKAYRFGAFCRDRYEHGYNYARRRVVDAPRKRWLYLPGTAILAGLQTLRVWKCVGPRNGAAFVRALPFTFAFLAAWSIGEAFGYVRGRRGTGMGATASETTT